MKFDAKPDYKYCRQIFEDYAIRENFQPIE